MECVIYVLLIFSSSLVLSIGEGSKIPRLGALRSKKLTSISSESVAKFYYSQTLDHFNHRPESHTIFCQRYVMDFNYWAGANSTAPIFAYLGAEEALDDALSIGFPRDNAPRFKALIVYLEHRYYGKSMPFGSGKDALRNASTLGYLSSAQAIADYAAILLHIKKKLSAHDSPIIVIGGSYGGMLAAWFRLKYPHVALGALASSAPVLYFDGLAAKAGYYSIVSKDFKETSESCYNTIRKSWGEIDRIASKPEGLSILSTKFKTCNPLKKAFDLKDYLDSLYADAAQYNSPATLPVGVVCGGIDEGEAKGRDLLGRIFAGVVAYMGQSSCYDMDLFNYNTSENLAWRWQSCTEMVMPIGHEKDTMFQPASFNMNTFINKCKTLFGVRPQPHWVTTYYGGHDLKLILHRFGSNIIFSNGLRDPYSAGGVLKNISDSVVAVYAEKGSHCLDIQPANKKSDPDWLVMQRETEVKIIEGWISKYHNDLLNLKYPTHAHVSSPS